MTRQVAIREVSHLRLSMPPGDSWTEQLSWIPVSFTEYHLACRHFPFAMRVENQRPELGLLVHPRYLVNPLLDASGKWRGVYRPIGLRCFPFEPNGDGEDALANITIAADSKYLSSSDGIPFLDEQGKPGRLVTELHRLIRLLQKSREMFVHVLDQYLIAGLLVPLIDSEHTEAASPLYVIDQRRLSQLSQAALGAMARHSFLSIDLAIAWAFSLHNLRANYLPREAGRSRLQPQPASADPILASDATPIDDLPLVLDDGELVWFAEIATSPPEDAWSS